MRSKLAFMATVAVIVCSTAITGSSDDKLYYGGFHVQALPEKLQEMKDSLRFNLVFGFNVHNYINTLANASLQAVAEQPSDIGSPTYWSQRSHYTVWEAEGYPGSYYGFTYSGGTLSSDASASGGKVQVFTPLVDQPGMIQTGPGYYQERELPGDTADIPYTATFRIKSPTYNPRGMGVGDDTLCVLMVVGQDSLLAQRIVYASSFKNYFGYKEFNLTYRATLDSTEFRIYWPGRRVLGIDYVKVYDESGERLMSGFIDSAIVAYVNQDWVYTEIPETGNKVVYRWYMKDEPSSIDCYAPYAYIDALLQNDTIPGPHIPGAQWFCFFDDPVKVQDYFLRSDPVDYLVNLYPFYAGDTGSSFQPCLDTLAMWLNDGKRDAESLNKDLWVAIQAHAVGDLKTGDPCDSTRMEYEYPPGSGTYFCLLLRDPTPIEVRLQTFLAMCYGADGVMNYTTAYYLTPTYLETGLYDINLHMPTPKWDEIKNFTGPRVEKIGQIIVNLDWQGACFYDTVGSFVLRNAQPSYIDSIVGVEPESTYVQVGFFEDAEANRYFMLVNRRTLLSQNDNVKVYLNLPDGPYIATDMYTDSPVGKYCGFTPLEIGLQPGEGRLFKLQKHIEQTGFVMYVPSYDYPTIQSAINQSCWWTTILVDTGTYYENLRFNGHNPTVTSYLHWYPDSTWFIENTIIDGSSLTCGSDSGSVVRFVDNEDLYAVLKGFTIRNGKGSEYIQKSEIKDCGGGIYCYYSSPTILNNIIKQDTAMYGGGIYCCNSSPQILKNVIMENAAIDGDGGGINIENYQQPYSGPIVVNNLIVNNSATNLGGGIYYDGQPVITNNTIDLNSAAGDGGGIYVNMAYGGHIENNIVTNSSDGGGLRGYSSADIIAYNDVWNNTEGNFSPGYPGGVGDTTAGQNRNGTPCDSFYNIVRDPIFYDGYHLDSESECINAGDNEALCIPPEDFDGSPRIKDEWVDVGVYEYQGRGSAGGGSAKYTAGNQGKENESTTATPYTFELPQNFPNPFNPVTNIKFTVGGDNSAEHVSLRIYNVVGQLVRKLVDDVRMPGSYVVTWDGKDESGKEVASGIYFYRLESAKFTESKKMVLLK